MGFDLASWDAAEGAIYMGAATNWPMIWTFVAAAMCVIALIVGSRHELDAYKRMKEGKSVDSGPL